MCILESATKSMSSAGASLYEGVKGVGASIARAPIYLNNKFVDLTNKVLPKSIATFTQQAVYALPVTIAMQTLPGQILTAALLTHMLAWVVLGNLSDAMHQTISIGIRNSFAFNAARHIVEIAKNVQPSPVSKAITNILFTAAIEFFTAPTRASNDEESHVEGQIEAELPAVTK